MLNTICVKYMANNFENIFINTSYIFEKHSHIEFVNQEYRTRIYNAGYLP